MNKAYAAYLKTRHWETTRRRILDRAAGRCERCKRRGLLQIHHLTYARLYAERDADLLALCKPCHTLADAERKHAAARARANQPTNRPRTRGLRRG